jgi:hypothetical protein
MWPALAATSALPACPASMACQPPRPAAPASILCKQPLQAAHVHSTGCVVAWARAVLAPAVVLPRAVHERRLLLVVCASTHCCCNHLRLTVHVVCCSAGTRCTTGWCGRRMWGCPGRLEAAPFWRVRVWGCGGAGATCVHPGCWGNRTCSRDATGGMRLHDYCHKMQLQSSPSLRAASPAASASRDPLCMQGACHPPPSMGR